MNETIPRLSCPLDLPHALRDGVVLCKLVNVFHPGSITRIHDDERDSHHGANLKIRKNVDNFLEACRKMQLVHVSTVSSLDILQGAQTLKLIGLIRQLL